MVLMTGVSFYTITAYTPTFGKEILMLTQNDALLVTLCVGLSNLFWLLAYSLATTIGGSTPAIVTFLIHATGNRAMPDAWLSVAATIALLATLIRGDQVRAARGA